MTDKPSPVSPGELHMPATKASAEELLAAYRAVYRLAEFWRSTEPYEDYTQADREVEVTAEVERLLRRFPRK